MSNLKRAYSAVLLPCQPDMGQLWLVDEYYPNFSFEEAGLPPPGKVIPEPTTIIHLTEEFVDKTFSQAFPVGVGYPGHRRYLGKGASYLDIFPDVISLKVDMAEIDLKLLDAFINAVVEYDLTIVDESGIVLGQSLALLMMTLTHSWKFQKFYNSKPDIVSGMNTIDNILRPNL